MTTAAEVKQWLRPLLERDSRLALVGRNLVLTPINHVIRGIYIDQTSNAHWSNPIYYLTALYKAPSSSQSFGWAGYLTPGRNDAPSFSDRLIAGCNQVFVDILQNIDSIEAFVEHITQDLGVDILDVDPKAISYYYREFSVTLAALGRIEEAKAILLPLKRQEANFLDRLERGRALLAKRSNSRIGKRDLDLASFQLDVINRLKRLETLLDAGDRAGIAALLHEWEAANIRKWKLEHLWTPSPFPIELGAGT